MRHHKCKCWNAQMHNCQSANAQMRKCSMPKHQCSTPQRATIVQMLAAPNAKYPFPRCTGSVSVLLFLFCKIVKCQILVSTMHWICFSFVLCFCFGAYPFVCVAWIGSALTFLDPHGVPSGGDWALQRSAAIFVRTPPLSGHSTNHF